MTTIQKQLGDWTARPTHNDPRVDEKVFASLMPEILEWLGKDYRDEADEHIRELLKHSWANDGYQLARSLEQEHYWTPDTGLVDILDGIESKRFRFHREIVAEWVAGSGRTPKLTSGDVVNHEGHEGKIVGVDLKQGTYTVCVPELGHVENGTGTLGVIIAWEELDA